MTLRPAPLTKPYTRLDLPNEPYRIVSVIAYVTPICSRAAALRRHPLGKIVKRTREEMVIRAECGGLRSFTQLLARLPLVLLAEALTGRVRSQGIRSHQ